MRQSIDLAANLMGFKATVQVNEGVGQTFCKYTVSLDAVKPFCWKAFHTSFFKHGWTTQKVKPGS